MKRMKLVSFQHGDRIKAGVVQGDSVIDLGGEFPDVLSVIQAGDEGKERIQRIVSSRPGGMPLEDVQLLAPIPKPLRNVMCVGWNYLKHFEERVQRDIELPDHPTVFTKATTAVAGPFEDIPVTEELSREFDYEAEFAVIIGKPGRGIREEEALDHVYGYTVANDMSARSMQLRHGGQWFLGKSVDKSCPMGPWIVTKGEVPDPQNLDISCTLNGQVMQSSHTSLMIFPIKRIISEISRYMTLLPGDIILTGTPEGVGSRRNPPVFLKPGDVVEVAVSGVGQIKNRIVRQS
jgi:2-keto-4-pentenoate hydratase/2-oxohepta-3-ene-1,7-dioic acid hydratase in catechol pathway